MVRPQSIVRLQSAKCLGNRKPNPYHNDRHRHWDHHCTTCLQNPLFVHPSNCRQSQTTQNTDHPVRHRVLLKDRSSADLFSIDRANSCHHLLCSHNPNDKFHSPQQICVQVLPLAHCTVVSSV